MAWGWGRMGVVGADRFVPMVCPGGVSNKEAIQRRWSTKKQGSRRRSASCLRAWSVYESLLVGEGGGREESSLRVTTRGELVRAVILIFPLTFVSHVDRVHRAAKFSP